MMPTSMMPTKISRSKESRPVVPSQEAPEPKLNANESRAERLGDLYGGRQSNLLILLDGKKPIETSWNERAVGDYEAYADPTPRLERVAAHVAAGGNVGLVIPPGVLGLDADTQQEFELLCNAIEDAPAQKSHNGGHVLVRAPKGLKIPQRCKVEIMPGLKVDLRCAGAGQIAVEPSIHPEGTPYQWERELPLDLDDLPELPPYLEAELRKQLERKSPPTDGEGRTFRKGEQHHRLVSVAGTLRKAGLSVEEIYASLLPLNDERCEEPGTPAEMRAIAESAGKWERGGDQASDPLVASDASVAPVAEPDDEKAFQELAALTGIEYDRRRKEAAADLGLRTPTLDAEVAKRRPKTETEAQGGSAVLFAEHEPWPEHVSGDELLTQLTKTLRRFLALPDHAAVAMALWVLHAHTHDASPISPILTLSSPEKRCGKTTALSILHGLTPRALPAANITPAALFRATEKWRPTLLIDEADTFLRNSEELRGILNSGHNRSQAVVIRTVGDDHEPRAFSTWAPKAVALIGVLPPTLEDRSVVISMRRRRADEKVERLRGDRDNGLGDLARQCARWAIDSIEELRLSDALVPKQLHDRAADNWRPLLAIADAAGGDWPGLARQAAVSLTPGEDETSTGVLLLGDIKMVMSDKAGASVVMASKDLCEALVELPDRPWAEIRKGGRPLTTNGLARKLKPFGIRPGQKRIGDVTLKGYALADFTEEFERYLPSAPQDPSETSKQVSNTNGLAVDPTETRRDDVSVGVSPNPPDPQSCFGVSDGDGPWGEA